MAQFDVYRNANTATRARIPYLLDVQSDLLDPFGDTGRRAAMQAGSAQEQARRTAQSGFRNRNPQNGDADT